MVECGLKSFVKAENRIPVFRFYLTYLHRRSVNFMDLNRRNVKKIMFIVAFAIVLFLGLQNIDNIYTFFKVVFSLLSPFLMGLCIAFILNVPMKFIEEKFFPPRRQA